MTDHSRESSAAIFLMCNVMYFVIFLRDEQKNCESDVQQMFLVPKPKKCDACILKCFTVIMNVIYLKAFAVVFKAAGPSTVTSFIMLSLYHVTFTTLTCRKEVR